MKMDRKISVIVPVYNVEQYLEECLESICGQTYKNLEIILVDDGSTDQSGEICDRYAKRDGRVSVVHKKNGGLSDARNAGIEVATGDCISLIDSDDYVSVHMMERMLGHMEKTKADVVICNFSDLYGERNIKERMFRCESEMTGRRAFQKLLEDGDAGYVVAWNKLYRASLFAREGIRYPAGYLHEDCFTTYKLFLKSEKVTFLNEPLYIYRHREGSITDCGKIRFRYDVVKAYQEICDYARENERSLAEAAKYRYIIANLDYIRNAHSWKYKEHILKSRENILRASFRKNPYLKGQRKIRALILAKFPYLYAKLSFATECMKKIIRR